MEQTLPYSPQKDTILKKKKEDRERKDEGEKTILLIS